MIRHILILGALTISSPELRAVDDAPPSVKATLGVGSKAPALNPGKWLKGEPVASFDPDKVYLVECWATWCGPCIAAIPHMNELHNQFKDQGLVIIGMNVMGDTEEKAAAFVDRKGDRMAYRVAYDGKAGRTAKDWLQAAGVPGIPHSFLVREGRILWHGHPSELTEADIREVLKGGAIASKPAAERDGPSEEVVAYRKARLEILGLLRNNESDKALALISENEAILTDTAPADTDVLRGMAYSVKGDREQSLAHYHKAIKAADGDAVGLYRVVHGLLDHGSVRDPGLALKCAREAAAKDPNPVVRRMLARAENAAGNKAAAIAILEQLVGDEGDETHREELRALKDDGPVPFHDTAEKKAERMRWFDGARFGMFIHWGLYSQLGGEWKDRHVTGGAEWIQKYLEIPSSEYMPLAQSFTAAGFDADAWIKAIADAGVKYVCVTTKHHDGFCMWPTKLNSDWNITITPFKRDPLKELSEACKHHNVTFCIYHSILDWHHADWPGRPPFNDYAKGAPDKEKFRTYLYGQLKELFTNYGEIGMIWLDGSWDRQHWTSEDGKQLEDFIRTLQPSVVINNRSGHLPPQPELDFHIENPYSYVFAGDYISPEGEVPATGLPGIHWETCQTMQLPNNWGYSRITGFRTYTDLLRQFIDVASKGGNLLLNIGPTGEGLIPPQSLGCLEKFGAWMKVNGVAIYGTTASPFAFLPFDGRCTRKGQTLYLHVFKWPENGSIHLPATNQVKRAWLLGNPDQPLATRATAGGIEITLPEAAPDPVASVIAIEIEGEPKPFAAPKLASKGIRPVVSSFWPGREEQLDAKFITDGDPNTMWAAEEKARDATVTIDLGTAYNISEIVLSDAPYGRTREFDVEAKTAGGWRKIAGGTTIGAALRLPVDGMRAKTLRLNIRKASDTPTLADFQIFARSGD